MAVKWLGRLFRRQQKTPLPPKPYVDTASAGRHMVDARMYDMDDLKHIDPEKPHWQDPRFDSRENVPFFDFFGYNRDWSWTLFKVFTLFFVAVLYWETRTFLLMRDDPGKITSTTSVSPVPDYARDEEATEEELRKAGYVYVGVKKLDHLSYASIHPSLLLSTAMNEVYARRLAQTSMFHNLMRSHSTLWAATQITKEKLDTTFIREELMRVNGHRAMPLLIAAAADESLSQLHFSHLTEHCAWTESARAYAVQNQTPMTQHIASMGRMAETITQTRTATTSQTLFNEHMSRVDGISAFEEEPITDDID